SYATWWSLKPSTYPFRNDMGDPVAEVVRQVRDSRLEFRAELERPGVNSVCVTYEALCAAPRKVLERIAASAHALGLEKTPLRNVPPALKQGRPPALPAGLAARLRRRHGER